ncbi:hypothetical protein I7I53_02154 [Histoplasma capsulatum var. duboisii H88]|uniref:Uncharacterized protein n=1 Tax=Ajellomyces capsulatus (strain H88) TaxID=544711 RepID=A0A8A1LKW3_AJEC8|nr:hypothetical protein I7I53_02154 [Histoplasma capsulatum var. duboisii H88]
MLSFNVPRTRNSSRRCKQNRYIYIYIYMGKRTPSRPTRESGMLPVSILVSRLRLGGEFSPLHHVLGL